jgi:inosine/xanthosine triphosphatase
MRIIIGTANNVKVGAVADLIPDYPCIAGAEVAGLDVPSGVSPQPKTLDETMTGAMNRARGAWERGGLSVENGDLAFGIESGLMVVPFIRTGHMDVTVCAIFDGGEFEFGLSSCWEAPDEVAKLMLEHGLDMNEAFFRAGYTQDRKIGSAGGAISVLTKGRLTRKSYTMEAIRTALIHIEAKRDKK